MGIGAAGGGLFFLAHLPLAWMLGAMATTTAAALGGVPVAFWPPARGGMIAVLGVALGSTFYPDVIDQAGRWLGGLAVLAGYVAVTSALVYRYFRRVGGFDPVTAYFASTPGGFNEMVVVSEAMGGQFQTVALVHATRVLVAVFTIPLAFRFGLGLDVPALAPGSPWHLATDQAVILAGCLGLGWPAARLARVPAAALVGPMVLSAAAHLTGLATASPPAELVAAAQVVVGAAVGARFAGLQLSHILVTVRLALGSTALFLVTATVLAWSLAGVLGVPVEALMLALAPGGLAEMALVALALGVDTAFVSTMHVCRIAMVVICAPVAFRLARRAGPRDRTGPAR